MQDLETRKKNRIAERERLAHGGVIGIIEGDSQAEGKVEGGTAPIDEFEGLTIAQLQAKAQELGTPVPKEITVKADVLKFVRNLNDFVAAQKKAEAEGGVVNTGNTWQSGQ